MIAVSDSTPLIHLAKIGKLNYLNHLFDEILIPKEVYEEVIKKGNELNKSEVYSIEQHINKFIKIKETNLKIKELNLHIGELKAISLCKELKIKNILIDDKEGYKTALMLELKPLRTTSIILKLLKKKIINLKEYKESLLNLSKSRYFMSAELYNELLEVGRMISLKE